MYVDEFTIEYDSFFMDDEPQYDAFDCDMRSVDFIIDVVSVCNTSTASLDLKSLPNILNYAFSGPDESLPMMIASNLG